MSHSTYVGKMASPAVESSWHLPLSISFPHHCISTQSHFGLTPTQGGRQWMCIDAFLTGTAHLKGAWTLEHRPTHAPSVFCLTSSTHIQSVVGAYPHRYSQRAWFRPLTKAPCGHPAALLTWCASSNDAVSDLGICPSWALSVQPKTALLSIPPKHTLSHSNNCQRLDVNCWFTEVKLVPVGVLCR